MTIDQMSEPRQRTGGRAGPLCTAFRCISKCYHISQPVVLALLRLILTNSTRAGHGSQTVQGLRRLRRRRRSSFRTSTASPEARTR